MKKALTSLHSTMFLLIRCIGVWRIWLENTLHSTMFLLIQEGLITAEVSRATLHSTMFLLIHGRVFSVIDTTLFTFHNVSINTNIVVLHSFCQTPLHSTMFLLIRLIRTHSWLTVRTLHSTMFLLIPQSLSQ